MTHQPEVPLRDYFAGLAMQGLLAGQLRDPSHVAKSAYAIADEMIAMRHRTLAASEWMDSKLPEDEEIFSAHPVNSGRHDLYSEAMRLVGARRSKAGLIELVTWLLSRIERPGIWDGRSTVPRAAPPPPPPSVPLRKGT